MNGDEPVIEARPGRLPTGVDIVHKLVLFLVGPFVINKMLGPLGVAVTSTTSAVVN